MIIDNQEDWWKSLDQNKDNIVKIISRFHPDKGMPGKRNWGEQIDILIGMKDWANLSHIMNAAWFNAPDTPSLQLIPGWLNMCDLMSETWVFQEEPEN